MRFRHFPVMQDEVVHYLNCGPGKIFVDGTLGGAGHARAILAEIRPEGKLIGIDQDRDAIDHARQMLASDRSSIHLFHDNFIHLPNILRQLDIAAVDGIVLDLGLSLHQLEGSGRGFSFQKNEPLDMRMNTATETTAEHLVNTLPEKQLEALFRQYGEERWSRSIARNIAAERAHEAIRTTGRLCEIITAAVPGKQRHRRIHPATRVFMALRIAVNRELDCLDRFLDTVPDLLVVGGRLCVISFHSLEDRRVKHRIRALASPCQCPPGLPECRCGGKIRMNAVGKKPIRPSQNEIEANPRARSAILRVAEKV